MMPIGTPAIFGVVIWQAKTCQLNVYIAFAPANGSHVTHAQACGCFYDAIEHRLEIELRAANYVEHVARCRLVLERLRELVRARLHLLEQPCILDSDHGLVGKDLQESDLLFVEGSNLIAPYLNGSDRRAFP